MGTPFAEIYQKFLAKIKTYEFYDLTDKEIEAELQPFLETATSNFMFYCHQKEIRNTDFSSDSYPVNLTLVEKDILAEGMLLAYIDLDLNNLDIYTQTLNSRDYRTYSEANMLNAKLKLQKETRAQLELLLSRYSYHNKGLNRYEDLFK